MARFKVNGGTVWHANHQGAGTGMDADKTDGYEGAALLPSDARLKRDINPIATELSVDEITNLLKAYRYNNEDSPQHYGVIAQSLLPVDGLKELVQTTHDDMLAIEPLSLMFYLINSLAVELANTKQELATLKSEVG